MVFAWYQGARARLRLAFGCNESGISLDRNIIQRPFGRRLVRGYRSDQQHHCPLKGITMTAILDFAVLPPEVNSARMYAGAGSGPMAAAASAWKGLAAELRSTAQSYGSLLTALTNEEWRGPASAAMAAAAAPYVAWVSGTAAQAEQTATQVEAAVAAYEAAYAATVSPAEIAANRSQLASLVATNILGQNTPAIAANEAQYGQMWAQDAVAMYAYAGASALATQLTAFTEPQQTTIPSALIAQSAAVGQAAGIQQSTLAQLIASVPSALRGLANPAASTSLLTSVFAPSSGSATSGLSGLLNVISGSNGSAFGQLLNANIWNTIFSSGFYMPGNFLGTLSDFMSQADVMSQGTESAGQAAGGAANGAATAIAGPLGDIGAIGKSVSAGLDRSSIIGTLSVPPSWTVPAPPHNPLSSTLGGTPMMAPPPAVAAGLPGMPLGGNANQAYGRALPQYGFRPTFVARPPAAG
jgi:PPE-repeat protein